MAKWSELPHGWAVALKPIPKDQHGEIDPDHPFASKGGINALNILLAADVVWSNLTRPQRELLLSTVAGAPIKARADVQRRLVQRGLIVADPFFDDTPVVATDAGRFVVQWRPRPRVRRVSVEAGESA